MTRLLVFCACACWLAACAAGQEDWRRRDRSGPSAAAAAPAQFAGDRDPLLYNMFEVLISSLDDKFKRVDTIERAIHMVMRHMEIMDGRLQESNNMTAKILGRVERMEQRLGGAGFQPTSRAQPAAPTSARMEQQLDGVQRRLDRLQHTLESLETAGEAREARVSPPRATPMKRNPARARGRTTQDVSHQLVKDAERMVQTINEVRGKVVAMDTKLNLLSLIHI